MCGQDRLQGYGIDEVGGGGWGENGMVLVGEVWQRLGKGHAD